MALGFVVSPAKKMNVVEGPPFPTTTPAFADEAQELLDALRGRSYGELKALWKCSDKLAALNEERVRHTDLTRGLTAAVLAYEGIQYQHLAPQVMSEDELRYLERHLRILSGFYGVLRPTDGVVPYRLEMQARLEMPAPDGTTTKDLYGFWGTRLAEALAHAFDLLVNVASVEYAKAVVPHLESRGVRVLTCLFGTVRPSDGKLLQRSTEAKAARGDFVRWCAEHEACDEGALRSFDSRGYALDEERSSGDVLVFVR